LGNFAVYPSVYGLIPRKNLPFYGEVGDIVPYSLFASEAFAKRNDV
jgi:hypothetical protein